MTGRSFPETGSRPAFRVDAKTGGRPLRKTAREGVGFRARSG